MLSFLHVLSIALSGFVIVGDICTRRVRNTWLLTAILLSGAWVALAWFQGVHVELGRALVGLLIGLLAMLPFYVFGWMGAGDVKFFAVLGFLLGGKALLPIWIVASLLGGVHAVVLLLSRHAGPGVQALQMQWGNTRLWQRVLVARQGRKGLPMAAYMAVGALATVMVPQLAHW